MLDHSETHDTSAQPTLTVSLDLNMACCMKPTPLGSARAATCESSGLLKVTRVNLECGIAESYG